MVAFRLLLFIIALGLSSYLLRILKTDKEELDRHLENLEELDRFDDISEASPSTATAQQSMSNLLFFLK